MGGAGGKAYCTGLCDLPTVLSSLWARKHDVDLMRVQYTEKHGGKESPIRAIDVPAEIIDFQSHLVRYIEQYEETRGRVRVPSIPELPVDAEAVLRSIEALDAKREE